MPSVKYGPDCQHKGQILDQLIPSLYLLSLLCWLLIRRYLSDHHGTQNSASAAQTEIWVRRAFVLT
jgi:hypothetical protein